MAEPAPTRRSRAGAVVLFSVATLLFVSPVHRLFLDVRLGVWAPFVVWAVVIALAAVGARRSR